MARRKSDSPVPDRRPSRRGDPGHPVIGKPSPLAEPGVLDAIVQAISAGSTQAAAAERVGVTTRTLERWKARGMASVHAMFDADEAGVEAPPPDEPYHTLAVRMLKAAGTIEVTAVASIVGAFKNDWRAAAWWLERARSTSWADWKRVSIGGDPDAPPIGVAVAQVGGPELWSQEERAVQVLRALAEAGVPGMGEAVAAIEATAS